MIVKAKCMFSVEALRFATKPIFDDNGNWGNRILDSGILSKNIADNKYYEISGLILIFNDKDKYFRKMMSGQNRYISGKLVTLLATDDTVLYEGVVSGWDFGTNIFELHITDELSGIKLKLTETIQVFSYPDAVNNSIGLEIPIIFGELTDTLGAVKCWKTATGKYLVSAHHCKIINNVFEAGVEVISGWSMDNNADGKCYITYSVGTEDWITINVQGSMDSSSNLITKPITALKNLIENYTDMSYDNAIFTESESVMEDRSYIINSLITDETLEEYLSVFCITFSSDFYLNRKKKIEINTLNLFDVTPVGRFSKNNIYLNSFSISEDPKEIINKIKYNYNYDYINKKYRHMPETKNQTSISNWGEFYKEIAFKATADNATALDAANRILQQSKDPKRTIRFSLSNFVNLNFEVAKVILVEHPQGIVETPEKYQIRRMNENFKDDSIGLECLKIPPVGDSFILGDRTSLASTWESADADDRAYGYLGDRYTGFFANGIDPAKTLS